MQITRNVIIDLLPVYLAGDASLDTRSLVEDYLKTDQELAGRLRSQWAEIAAGPATAPPDLELRVLRRTRGVLSALRWLMGCAIFFSASAFSNQWWWDANRVRFRFVLAEQPALFGGSLAIGVGCWIAYFVLRRRLRATGL